MEGLHPAAPHGFVHLRIVSGRGDTFTNPVPDTHVAIGNLKVWLIGTHKGVRKRGLLGFVWVPELTPPFHLTARAGAAA